MSSASFWFDLKSAWRGVRSGRWASATAVLALAVGIGASVSAAMIAYAGLARPLPFPRANELVTLKRQYRPTKLEAGVQLADFENWRRHLAPAMRLIASASERATLREAGAPQEIHITYVLGPYFETLGVRPLVGRLLVEQDDLAAVVSRAFAVKLAGTPEAAVGRSIAIGAHSLFVVGVAPDSLSILNPAIQVWTPAREADQLRVLSTDDERDYAMMARLLPGRTVSDAQAAATQALPDFLPSPQVRAWFMTVEPLRKTLIGDLRMTLLVVAGAALLLLLIACANVAMLLANRAVARQREYAVRLALGGGVGRLIRTTLLETALLTTSAAAGGWWIAALSTRWLSDQAGLALPRVTTFDLSWPLTVGVLAASVLVLVACTLAPTLFVQRAQLSALLRSTTTTTSRANRRLRGSLVAAQFAMMTMLLTGVGLLGRTLLVIDRTDLGVTASHRVLTLRVPIGESSRPEAARNAMLDDILTRVRALPGVSAVGFGSTLPPHDPALVMNTRYVSDTRDEQRKFDVISVTDGYLEALGARVVAGRIFQSSDNTSEQPVVVVSETALRFLASHQNDVGKPLNLRLPSAAGRRVRPMLIGVVRDIRFSGVTTPSNGGIYVLWRQIPLGEAFLTIRSAGDLTPLASEVTQIVRSIDPSVPLSGAKTFDAELSDTIAPWTSRFALIAAFGAGAMLLAVVGLFGTLAHSVTERHRELAIRAAIGAAPDQLRGSILWQGLLLTSLGLGVGLVLSAAAGRALSAVIFGVRPYDPLTYTATIVGVLAIGLMGCYVPGRRAACVDPAVLLRSE